jgi:hypothetical protein
LTHADLISLPQTISALLINQTGEFLALKNISVKDSKV